MPKFMMLVKASADSEAGVMPTTEQFAEMGKYNEELVKAGVMLAGEGLHPSSRGARIEFKGNKKTVVDGPFAETKELIAGFWIIQVGSREEALDWVTRWPEEDGDGEVELELRELYEADDFGDEFTPDIRRQETLLREKAGQGSN